MISLVKLKILTHLQKLPKNVRGLGKQILPKALKSCPSKSPNLVTLNVALCLENCLYCWLEALMRRGANLFRRMAAAMLDLQLDISTQ